MITVEQSVVGAILLDERVLSEVEAKVQPRDFVDQDIARIIGGMVGMRRSGEPIDALTVGDKLKVWGVESITAVELHTWVGQTFVASNAGWYAQQVADEALRRSLIRVAGRVQEDAAGDPGQVIRDAQRDLEALADRHSRESARRWTVADLMDVDTAHDWLVPGLLEHRDRLMLTGAEGLGKSLLLQQFAFGLAAGRHPFDLGQRIEPRRVLFLDAENSERQWARRAAGFLDTIGGVDLGDLLQVEMLRRVDLVNGRDLASVQKSVKAANADLVVIGPLYRLVPRAIQTDDEATPLLAALDTLRDDGAALLIEAHAGKQLGEGGRRSYAPRGSSALLGWPEYGFGLSPDPSTPGLVDFMAWRGQREQRDWPKRLLRNNQKGWPWILPHHLL